MLSLLTFNKATALRFCARIIALLTAIPLHESAHGYVSYRLGDPTAKYLGRISLNPSRHFDLFGTLCMLLFGFGWARPVPINPRYYRSKKVGMALSSLAGPVSNLLLALVLMLFFKTAFYFYHLRSQTAALHVIEQILSYMVSINIALFVFNLLPVPPLDGSRIFLIFLPEQQYFAIMQYERYIMIALFALLSTGMLTGLLGFLQLRVFELLNAATHFFDKLLITLLSPSTAAYV